MEGMDLRSKVLARLFAAFMQIYGLERRNKGIHMHGVLGVLMADYAFYCTWHLQHRAGVVFQI